MKFEKVNRYEMYYVYYAHYSIHNNKFRIEDFCDTLIRLSLFDWDY